MQRGSCIAVVLATEKACMENEGWRDIEPVEVIPDEPSENIEEEEPTTSTGTSSITIQRVEALGQYYDPFLVELPRKHVDQQNNPVASVSVSRNKKYVKKMVKLSRTSTGWCCIFCRNRNIRTPRGMTLHIIRKHKEMLKERSYLASLNKMVKNETEDQAHDTTEDEQFSFITSTERRSEQMNYEPDTTLNGTSKPWICKPCSKSYTAKSSLDRHLKDKHF